MMIIDLMLKSNLVASKGEARRLIEQGGVSICSGEEYEKVKDVTIKVSRNDFKEGYIIIKKGKKVYHKIILK